MSAPDFLTGAVSRRSSPPIHYEPYSPLDRVFHTGSNTPLSPAIRPDAIKSTSNIVAEPITSAGPRVGYQSFSPGSTEPGKPALRNKSGMIPCFADVKSGSSILAEKQKANSDASRRFRGRKNEIEQLKAQVESKDKDIRALVCQRVHYRSERGYFRGCTSQTFSQERPNTPAAPSTSSLNLPENSPSVLIRSKPPHTTDSKGTYPHDNELL
ncbi:hypothetical protein N7537_004544 [Penicillium hordei]|uniref:BZIP domain-containing protein n=1 Tax=Penicillium hordei TaxID=40994 RepID=A0AAD6EBG6_9EURO|nr:uncharacterized protein N7537_004544 [Penicillium hordei]KAJ5607925.1 hypothetical protein N7537_004544 [Penicillium hordei]